MPKLAIAAAMFLAMLSVPHARAGSESLSCQTINGQTVCLHSTAPGAGASLACRSLNGRTVCVGSGGVRCETMANGRLVCRGGDGSTRVQTFGPGDAGGPPPSADENDDD